MFNRLYHVSCVVNNLKKQGIKLNKMLNPNKKRQFYPSDPLEMNKMPTVKSLTKLKNEPGKQAIRRMAMLNKLFMKHITDLMSTGSITMGIIGHGIEISKVKVSPDFQTVSVFWVSKGNISDVETDNLLNKIAGPLRHELSMLRAMGEVPYIVFVKDQFEAQVIDLDNRLASADYGEDYTPTEIGHILKTEFTLDTKLSPQMKAKINQLEKELTFEEEPIPEMTHTVFGLDHAKIMNRLVAARKKSRDAWVNLDANTPAVISYRTNAATVSDVTTENQKQELADFLFKRQILQNKLRKQMHKQDWMLTLDDKDDDKNQEEPYDEMSEDEEMYESEDNYCYGGSGRLQFASKEDSPKL